jgi:RHS repeat-associated protein
MKRFTSIMICRTRQTLFTNVSGKEVRRIAFGPYGSLRYDSAAVSISSEAHLPDGIRFTGQPFDTETGLICLGRRYFDPNICRFISADRAVSGVYLPDSWDRYAYGHNNPLRYSDPSGRSVFGDFLAAVGVAAAVVALVVAGFFTGGATWAVAGIVINVSGVMFEAASGIAVGAV